MFLSRFHPRLAGLAVQPSVSRCATGAACLCADPVEAAVALAGRSKQRVGGSRPR